MATNEPDVPASDVEPFIQRLAYAIATIGYLGKLFPFAGTAGTVIGITFLTMLRLVAEPLYLWAALLTALGMLTVFLLPEKRTQSDPSEVIIDEVAGISVALLFLPFSLPVVSVAFCLFRVFDGLKPWPVSRVDNWRSAFGIMGDDLLAGLMTNVLLHIGRTVLRIV